MAEFNPSGQCHTCCASSCAPKLGQPDSKHAKEVADHHRYRPGWCAGIPAGLTKENPGGASQAQWAGNDTHSRANSQAESIGQRTLCHPGLQNYFRRFSSMATTAENGDGKVLRSERIAGGILPRVLNTFDMIAIFIAIVLFISNAGVIPGAGAAAFIYWILGFVAFLIPGAIVTGQLGLMFPGEGSIYVWTNKAFGAFLGFFAGFCAWWPGVLVMIATGDAVVSFIQLLGAQLNANFLSEPWQQGAVIIGVIAFSFFLSVLRFRLTQNFVNIVFLAYGGAILLVGLAGVLWLVGGHPSNTDFSLTAHNWLPNGSTASLYGLIILALLGIEVPLNMGVEINNMRSITRYLLWGSVVVMVAYLIGTFGVQLAVPVKDQPNPSAIAEAVQLGFGSAGKVL